MGRRGAEGWLGDLEPPGFMLRLEILSAFPEHKITSAAQKRMVHAASPRPKEQRPCYVCGRHRTISQSHHTVEIGLVTRILNDLAIYDWAPRIPTVSLCPNHHAYEHLLRRQKKVVPPEIAEAFRTELSEAEWERLIEMDDVRLDANENVWREIREEFLRRENAAGRSGLKPGGGAADTS